MAKATKIKRTDRAAESTPESVDVVPPMPTLAFVDAFGIRFPIDAEGRASDADSAREMARAYARGVGVRDALARVAKMPGSVDVSVALSTCKEEIGRIAPMLRASTAFTFNVEGAGSFTPSTFIAAFESRISGAARAKFAK